MTQFCRNILIPSMQKRERGTQERILKGNVNSNRGPERNMSLHPPSAHSSHFERDLSQHEGHDITEMRGREGTKARRGSRNEKHRRRESACGRSASNIGPVTCSLCISVQTSCRETAAAARRNFCLIARLACTLRQQGLRLNSFKSRGGFERG